MGRANQITYFNKVTMDLYQSVGEKIGLRDFISEKDITKETKILDNKTELAGLRKDLWRLQMVQMYLGGDIRAWKKLTDLQSEISDRIKEIIR